MPIQVGVKLVLIFVWVLLTKPLPILSWKANQQCVWLNSDNKTWCYFELSVWYYSTCTVRKSQINNKVAI